MIIEKCNNKEQVTNKLLEIFSIKVTACLKNQEIMRMAVATGNTFSRFLNSLENVNIPYERIDLFVVDEYAGVDFDDATSCTIDLCRDLKNINRFHNTYFFKANLYSEQIQYFNTLLEEHPLDIIFLGIGSDGHFAFCNTLEKPLESIHYKCIVFTDDEINMQVKNGWFDSPEDVPRVGITMTAYGVLKSRTVILSGYIEEKEHILRQITENKLPPNVPISEIIKREDVILVFG